MSYGDYLNLNIKNVFHTLCGQKKAILPPKLNYTY